MLTELTPDLIIDAHQDIAYNALTFGRDFTKSAYAKRRLEQDTAVPSQNGNATSGLPEALLGRVGVIFGTLYVSPAWVSFGGEEYSYNTPAEAEQYASKQFDIYERLADQHDQIQLILTQRDLDNVLASWAAGKSITEHKVGILVSMEGADPITEPKAFEKWYDRGLRACGLAWSETRYSGGTVYKGRGSGPLTDLGRQLLDVMASFNALLDLSHMDEPAYLEAVERYPGPIIASHSNPRRFRSTSRHLSDEMIRLLVERDGVIGTVPYNTFLSDTYTFSDPKNAITLSRYLDTIDYICQIAGSAQHVGIGSDFDGGFGVERIPAEMDTVADLYLIGPALRARGYTEADVQAILHGNFLRKVRAVLPH